MNFQITNDTNHCLQQHLHWLYGGGRNAGAKRQQETGFGSNWTLQILQQNKSSTFVSLISNSSQLTDHGIPPQRQCWDVVRYLI